MRPRGFGATADRLAVRADESSHLPCPLFVGHHDGAVFRSPPSHAAMCSARLQTHPLGKVFMSFIQRMRLVSVLWLLSMMTLSEFALAASITIATECAVGNLQRASTTDIASGASASSVCAMATPGLNVFNDLATGRGIFDASGLELGVFASMEALVVQRDLPFDTTTASAGFVDMVTPEGGATGSPGLLRLVFPIGGYTTVSSFPTNPPSMVTTNLTVNMFSNLTLLNSQTQSFSGPATLQFDIPIIYGNQTQLSISMFADIFLSGVSTRGVVTLDYLNTARLQSVELLDASGLPVTDGRLLSATPGLSYPAAVPVPEPATMSLLSVGLMAIAGMRRRRIRSGGTAWSLSGRSGLGLGATVGLVLWLTVSGIACSEHEPGASSPAAPTAALEAKPGPTNIPLTTIISDVDANGLAADISSDGQGVYSNSVSGVTSLLTENGYNGITFGDWQFDTNNSTGRAVGHSFDLEDAVQPGDPHYTAPPNPPYWGTQALKGKLEVKCTLLNRNMLTMTAGSSFTCPLVNGFKTASGTAYGLHAAYSFTGFPETTDAEIVCNATDSGGCNDWFIDPIGVGPSVARLTRPASRPNRPATNEGDFYTKFRIHLTRP